MRKFRSKLACRSALLLLPAKKGERARGKSILSSTGLPDLMLTLPDSGPSNHSTDKALEPVDLEVSPVVEDSIESLLEACQDKDTIVRWSGAKGLARVAERIPSPLAEQIVEAVVELFTVHTIINNGSLDLSAVSEHTWHGVCLSLAELARRGLLPTASLPSLMPWVYRVSTYLPAIRT